MEREKELQALEQKRAAASTDAAQLEVQLRIATHLESMDHVRCCHAFEQALHLATLQHNKAAQATCHEGMARMLWKLSDNPKAHTRYQLGLELYAELGDLYGVARCYSGLGIISAIALEYQTAIEYFEKALLAARKCKQDSFVAVLTGNIGNVYFETGKHQEAMVYFTHALKYHRQHGNDTLEAQMLNGMAGVHAETGQYEKALALLHQSLKVDRELGRSEGIASSMQNIGIVLLKQGKLEQALEQQLATLAFAQQLGYKSVAYGVHLQLSLIYEQLNVPEKASEHLKAHLQGEEEQSHKEVKKQNDKLAQFRG